MRAVVLLLLALATPLSGAAQFTLTWTPRGDLNDALPASIRVFEAQERSAFYVRAMLGAEEEWTVRAVLSDAPGGSETVASFAADAEALVAVNGGYFSGGQTFSLVAEDGQVLVPNIAALNRSGTTYYPTRSAFGVLEDGAPDVAWIYDVDGTQYAYPNPSPNAQGDPQPQPSATFPDGGAPWPVDVGIGGGPVLVADGQVRVTWEEEVFFGSGVDLGVRRARTAVGYDADGALLILSASESGGLTLTETAEVLVSLGATEAVNLDGGGSSNLVVSGTPLVQTSRAVTSAFMLAPPDDGGQSAAQFFDTGDACCYREAGGWFESSNTPYHGTTPARLNEVGEGSDRATFVFDGLTAGRYQVAAWWVPASNRATDTPYIIYQQGTGTTVRVNQADASTANQWNDLGTFELAPGDSVVVTDDAAGTATPAFVCVDALRLTPATGTAVDDAGGPASTLVLYPNPARTEITLAATFQRAGRGEGIIYDVLGRAVHRFVVRAASGPQRWRVALPSLASGLYLVRLTTPDGVWQHPLVVAR
jgi:hypothetical protein